MYDESDFNFFDDDLENSRKGIEKALALMKERGINSIHFKLAENPQEESSMTYFGGQPYVPKDFEWPYFEDCWTSDDEILRCPLAFIGQFNCQDLQPYDKEHILPESGILSFFYELESYLRLDFAINSLDQEWVRVYHFDSLDELHKSDFPEDLNEEYRLPKRFLQFNSLIDNDTVEDEIFRNYYVQGICDLIEDTKKGTADPCDPDWDNVGELIFDPEDFSELTDEAKDIFNGGSGGSHLLGYPNFFQGNEFDCSGSYDWRLLLQIDAEDFPGTGLDRLLCDGILFVALPEEDLIQREFDRTAGVIQYP